jgi:hypothetical protein
LHEGSTSSDKQHLTDTRKLSHTRQPPQCGLLFGAGKVSNL